MMLSSFLLYGGLSSCSLGALLGLVGLAKGREARRLDTATRVDNLADLRELWALVPLLIAVTGRVLAPKPYKCEMSECEAAIVELREKKKSERRAGGSAWVSDTQLLRESIRETDWGLADASRAQLPVEGGRDAEGDFLQMSGDRLIPDSSRQLVRLTEEILGSRTIGVRQVERMLPVGTVLTAVGELSAAVEHPSAFPGAVRQRGKMLVLRPPRDAPLVLSRQPLPELIASLQASSVLCQQWASGFATVGAAMLLAAAAQRAATWLRQRRIRKRVQEALRERRAAAAAWGEQAAAGPAAGQAAAGQAAGAGAEDGEGVGMADGLCVVCFDRPPNVVFPACGHMCACAACGDGLARCPICRSRGRPIRVFTP